MSDGPTLDGNAAQVRLIVQQTISALEATREKKSASLPAWAGVLLSVVTIIFLAGSLTGDVAVAKSQSGAATEAVAQIRAEQARMASDIKYLVAAEERRQRKEDGR